MAARITSNATIASLLIALSLLSTGADAAARELTSPESVPPAVVLSKERYEKAWHSYEEKMEECLSESSRTVNGNPLGGLGLSQREIEVAVFVMAGRAMEACEFDELGHLAFELGRFKAVAAHYDIGLPEWIRRDEQMLFAHRWRQLEKESGEYAALSSHQRSQIEQHPDLQTPFSFAAMLSKLRNGADAATRSK